MILGAMGCQLSFSLPLAVSMPADVIVSLYDSQRIAGGYIKKEMMAEYRQTL